MLTTHPLPGHHWRERIVGLERCVPLLDGRLAPYVSLDNAASTPALREVLEAVESFLPYYSSVHRGTGFKSRLSTAAYDKAHSTIARFVGADPRSATVIFGKNVRRRDLQPLLAARAARTHGLRRLLPDAS